MVKGRTAGLRAVEFLPKQTPCHEMETVFSIRVERCAMSAAGIHA
jgi:hypothetical protein